MKWLTVLVLLLGSASVWAQDETDSDRFALQVGAFFLVDSNTDLALSSELAPLGTSLNLERDLDIEEDATAARIASYYRFNPHHRIDVEWYEFDRDGSRIIDREIVFSDQVFEVGGGIQSELDIGVSKLAYTWSFHHTDDVELGFTVGAIVLDYEMALRNVQTTIAVDEGVTAPLPVLGLRLDYTINPDWHLLFDLETFYLEVENEIRGSLDDMQLSLEYRPFRHVFFGLGANRLAMDLEVEDDDLRWNVGDLYRGVQLYVGFRF